MFWIAIYITKYIDKSNIYSKFHARNFIQCTQFNISNYPNSNTYEQTILFRYCTDKITGQICESNSAIPFVSVIDFFLLLLLFYSNTLQASCSIKVHSLERPNDFNSNPSVPCSRRATRDRIIKKTNVPRIQDYLYLCSRFFTFQSFFHYCPESVLQRIRGPTEQ